MSGRRYIIHNALQIPTVAPTSTHGCRVAEEQVRAFYSNAAIATEYESHPDMDAIILALKSSPLSNAQLQFLLDKSHD